MDTTLINKALRVNLIEALALQSLPEEQKLHLIDSLTKMIGTKLMMRIEEKLSAADYAAFEKALDTGTGEQVTVWLKEKGLNLDEMTVEEVAKAKDDLMQRAEAVDKG